MLFSILTLISLSSQSAVAAERVWSAAQDGLSLGARVEGTELEFSLQNVSSETLKVWSHVLSQLGEEHLDWFSAMLTFHDNTTQTVRFLDVREGIAPVVVMLPPGAVIHHKVLLTDWIARPMNGGKLPPPGTYDLLLTYEVGIKGGWNGRLQSQSLQYGIPDGSGVVPPAPEKSDIVLEGDLF
jgi:hypothetical protein